MRRAEPVVVGVLVEPAALGRDKGETVVFQDTQTIDLKPVLSGSFPLRQLERAFAAAARPDTYRVFLTPNGL